MFYAGFDTGEILEFILGVDDRALDLYIKGFGRDKDGEVYVLVCTYCGPFNTSGSVRKIVDLCTARLPGDVNSDCGVDLLNLALLAIDWLKSTLRYRNESTFYLSHWPFQKTASVIFFMKNIFDED